MKVAREQIKAIVFDFDDTLAKTNSQIIVTMPDGSINKINATEFALQSADLEAAGATFDFSEFNKVVNGRKGPLADLALKRQDKFGSGDNDSNQSNSNNCNIKDINNYSSCKSNNINNYSNNCNIGNICKKKRKQKIPLAVKQNVWVTNFGEVYKHKCYVDWCHRVMTVFEFEVGHNIPESKGGTLDLDNLRPICHQCNIGMGNQYTIDEWSDQKFLDK